MPQGQGYGGGFQDPGLDRGDEIGGQYGGRSRGTSRRKRRRPPNTAGAGGTNTAAGGDDVTSSRNRFIDSMGTDPLALAGGSQDFLAQSAQGFANRLMPGLQRGLQSARSRFGGGAIRSGGAQEREEMAFERLFSNPLQDRISQLATTSLGYGQDEARRRTGDARDLMGFDQNRFTSGLDERYRRDRFGEDTRQFDERMKYDREGRKQERSGKRWGGIGKLLGGAAGSLFGPLGTAAGASLAGRFFGSDEDK